MEKELEWRGEPYNKKNWKFIRVQYCLTKILDRLPFIKKGLVRIRYLIDSSEYERKSKKSAQEGDYKCDVDRIFWVDPNKIQFLSLIEFDVIKDKGKIIVGEWDSLERRFEDLDVFIAFKERFFEGKKWDTTVYYQRVLDVLRTGKFLWDCKNKEDFDKRLENLESLFKAIKTNGYKTQQELRMKNSLNPIILDDEITVNIGRHGDLLFNNGAHRLSIAKLLIIPRIPVKITVRHPDWVLFKKQLSLNPSFQTPEKFKEFQFHIDLQDVLYIRDVKKP